MTGNTLRKIYKKKEQADRYNEGKLHWGLVDFASLQEMVKVLEYGANKYSRDNWKKGLGRTEVLESTMRHLTAMFAGEEIDEESSLPHVGHVMCNMLFYSYYRRTDKFTK